MRLRGNPLRTLSLTLGRNGPNGTHRIFNLTGEQLCVGPQSAPHVQLRERPQHPGVDSGVGPGRDRSLRGTSPGQQGCDVERTNVPEARRSGRRVEQ